MRTTWSRLTSAGLIGIALLSSTRCALYSDVTISPLIVEPSKISRGADLEQMLSKADYLRAVEMAPGIEARPKTNAADLVALGKSELAAGRFDAARRHLRAAVELTPFRDVYADAAWHLSQLEYLDNNFETSSDRAQIATKFGTVILQWHLDYLQAMANVRAYRFTGAAQDEVHMRIGRPDVPRVEVQINKLETPVQAVIDSGAVLSIMSERLARETSVRRLQTSRGVFYGLLGEPINVEFAIVDSLALGEVVIEDVPIAIMPDDKMRFLVNDRREFNIDFLLGANLLKEMRTELDFNRNTVTFTRLTSLDRVPAANQNMFYENFRPHVRGTVNQEGWFIFVLDTGSEVTYLNESKMTALPIDRFAPRFHDATLQGLGGAKKRGEKVEDVKLGFDRWSGAFRTIPMYSGGEQEFAVGILGENYLKRFRVVIDFGRMRLDLYRR